jgi:hypothetical protein
MRADQSLLRVTGCRGLESPREVCSAGAVSAVDDGLVIAYSKEDGDRSRPDFAVIWQVAPTVQRV